MVLYKLNSEKNNITMHIDFDKIIIQFYLNIYFPECNYVLKLPLISSEKKESITDFKIEKFSLTKYSYLLSLN